MNLNPVYPGHVLLIPKRHTKIENDKILGINAIKDFRPEEVKDLFLTAQLLVNKLFKIVHKTEQFTMTMQEGALAGQTVPHLHFHMIPV